MVKTKNLAVVLLSVLLLACKEEPWPNRVPYYGSEIRTDGFYYCIKKDYYDVYIFYKDGVVIELSNVDTLSQQFLERKYERCKTNWHIWHTFEVKDKDLWIKQKLKRHAEGVVGWNYFAYIENDTTFQFLYNVDISGEKKLMNQICCFKQFDYKPDSSYSYNFF